MHENLISSTTIQRILDSYSVGKLESCVFFVTKELTLIPEKKKWRTFLGQENISEVKTQVSLWFVATNQGVFLVCSSTNCRPELWKETWTGYIVSLLKQLKFQKHTIRICTISRFPVVHAQDVYWFLLEL